jgi:hypothetical protein
MREVNKASIAMTLRSQGSLGSQGGDKPGLDGVFSKPEPVPIHIDTDENDPEIHHLHSDGLSSALAAELLKKFGRNELPEKKTPKWKIVSARFPFSLPPLPSPYPLCLIGCLVGKQCAAFVLLCFRVL